MFLIINQSLDNRYYNLMKIGGVSKIKETSPDIVGTELFWTVNNLKQS